MMPTPETSLFLNPKARRGALVPHHAELVGAQAPASVRRYLSVCPRHGTTPLHRLDGLAKAHGLGSISAKDEGHRLGLVSFKALGGAYAVARLVEGWASEALRQQVAPGDLASEAVRAVAAKHTVTCATDGNHGRSVAAGAKVFGCAAVIFVHTHVADERRQAMAAFGAEIIEVAGNYDDSVAECARVAALRGWQVVSDTSYPGYTEIPGLVMQGYTVMVDEALGQLGEPPTHVFVQGGVGGLAAAVAGHMADRFGATRPKLIVVEPEAANCLLRSAKAGRAIAMTPGAPTIMGMLECYRPSDVAWSILQHHADAFMDVIEASAPDVMKRLALPVAGDPAIVAGESGGAGLAGALAAAADTAKRAALGLDAQSRVLVFISEGATSPSAYRSIVGHSVTNNAQ